MDLELATRRVSERARAAAPGAAESALPERLLVRLAGAALPAAALAAVAAALVARGRLAAALPWLAAVARRRPRLPAAHLALARLLLALGRPAAAEAPLAHAAALDPADPEPHLLLGDAALAAGRFERAAACFHRARARGAPAAAEAGLALAMLGLGEPRQALRLAGRAAAIDGAAVARVVYRPTPRPAAPATLAGRAALPDLAAAEAHFRAAVALAPGDATAQANLGACLAEQGRWPAARPLLERAARLAPADPVARALLAALLVCLDEPGPAVAALRAGAAGRPHAAA